MTAIIVIFILTAIFWVASVVAKEIGVRLFLSYLAIAYALVLGVLVVKNANHPTAIDVYRGKTELQVNYKVVGNDTIVTDSVVIYKEKEL